MTRSVSPSNWRFSDPRYDPEVWSLQYDAYPYLERLNDDQLETRYREIARNLEHLVCPARDIVPIEAHYASSWWWLQVMFQTEHECARRGKPLPKLSDPLRDMDRRRSCPENKSKGADVLVKYGERKYLEPMIREGVIRIRAASDFKDEVQPFDHARHDDELNMHRYIPGNQVTVVIKKTGGMIPVRGNLKQTTGLGNFYVFCCSREYDKRLFSEFRNEQRQPSDAGLIIHNISEFESRINEAVQTRLEDWEFYANPICYYDPYNAHRQHVLPGAYKDFQHAYQREYRFLWYSTSTLSNYPLTTFDVQLGSLADIAQLVSP